QQLAVQREQHLHDRRDQPVDASDQRAAGPPLQDRRAVRLLVRRGRLRRPRASGRSGQVEKVEEVKVRKSTSQKVVMAAIVAAITVFMASVVGAQDKVDITG